MTNKVGPNELGKHPEVIKKAQQELLKMDVLVCGNCQGIFHFVLGFEEHKENCKGALNNKQKPDLKKNWAFQLWKSAQANASSMTAWKLYQTWAQLDEKQQATWITAGQTIQTISRIGTGSVQETQVKVTRTVTGSVKVEAEATPKTEPDSDSDPKIKAEKNPYQKIDNSTNPPTLINRYMVKRTMNTSPTHIEVRECLAEKVTSRRLNSKRSMYEYLVKWSDFDVTWEPASHFQKAQELISELEKKMLKQKSNFGAAVATSSTASPASSTPGRPERTSKARAVNTLKSWLHTDDKSAAGAAAAGDLKRKNPDSDYAEGEESSQDESFVGSPSPNKQMKASPQIVQKMTTSGGQTRYFQKTNGTSSTAVNSAEVVVIDKSSGEKASGVRRKPGVVMATSPVKREAQVKVVGRNETTSSGIVRVGKTGVAAGNVSLTSPPTSPVVSPRMHKVIQTTRTATGTVKRTVYRAGPPTGTPTPVLGKPTVARPLGNTPVRTYQVNKQGVTRQQVGPPTTTPPTAAAAYKVSPNNSRVTRAPLAKPIRATTAPSQPPTRVVRSSPGGASNSPFASPVIARGGGAGVVRTSTGGNNNSQTASFDAASDGGAEMTLCPVTGKLISKTEGTATASGSVEDDSELQRLLTSEEEAAAEALAAAAAGGAGGASMESTQIHELIQNEDGTPVMITGDDGTVYQVAGKNAEGQTLLFTQGEEGEQQCVIMAAGTGEEGAGGDGAQDVVVGGEGDEGSQTMVSSSSVDGDSQDGQITAELVQADEPSADGTRRVVLLLPDGNLMVSEVNEEQYQTFNLGG